MTRLEPPSETAVQELGGPLAPSHPRIIRVHAARRLHRDRRLTLQAARNYRSAVSFCHRGQGRILDPTRSLRSGTRAPADGNPVGAAYQLAFRSSCHAVRAKKVRAAGDIRPLS